MLDNHSLRITRRIKLIKQKKSTRSHLTNQSEIIRTRKENSILFWLTKAQLWKKNWAYNSNLNLKQTKNKWTLRSMKVNRPRLSQFALRLHLIRHLLIRQAKLDQFNQRNKNHQNYPDSLEEAHKSRLTSQILSLTILVNCKRVLFLHELPKSVVMGLSTKQNLLLMLNIFQ